MGDSVFDSPYILRSLGPIVPALPFIGPALTVILMGYLWYGPTRLRIPAIVPGIPLALTSIALPVLAGTLGVLETFQDISTQKSTGIRSLANSIAEAMRFFPTAVVWSVGCILALGVFQVIRGRHGDRDQFSTRPKWTVPRSVFFWSLVSVLATVGLLWFFQRTIDLIFLIADPSRLSEANIRLGQISLGEVAAMISHRLVWSGVLSLAICPLLVQAAQLSLQVGEVSNWMRKASWTVAIIVTACIIPSGIVYYRELRYLTLLANPK